VGVLIAGGMLASGIFGVDIRQSMAYQIFAMSFVTGLVAAVIQIFV